MGLNLMVLRSPPEPPDSPSRQSAPHSRVLFVNTYKGKNQSAKVYKSYQIRPKSQQSGEIDILQIKSCDNLVYKVVTNINFSKIGKRNW
jgi:hypothetical protein